MADAIFLRHLLRGVQLAADDRGDGHAVDILETIQMLFAKGAGAGEGNTHALFSI